MANKQLQEEHVASLYVLSGDKRLVSVNEPWDKSQPAPLVYVGKTLDSDFVLYVGQDLSRGLYDRIVQIFQRGIFDPVVYAGCVGGREAGKELCYAVPVQSAPTER